MPIVINQDRFIPTGVGNAGLPDQHRSATFGSSPRVWGTRSTEALDRQSTGSSPRVWGTHSSCSSTAIHVRFIPTGVGNANCLSMPHASRFIPTGVGNLLLAFAYVQIPRFIPTGVGNAAWLAVRQYGTAVHPHGRGEHISTLPASLDVGSSPRVWGTHSKSTAIK